MQNSSKQNGKDCEQCPHTLAVLGPHASDGSKLDGSPRDRGEAEHGNDSDWEAY